MNRLFLMMALASACILSNGARAASTSIETGLTVSKVRTASLKKRTLIVGSSYEGTLLGVSTTGRLLWKNPLSGFMNHDVFCGDLTGDGIDEILTANADGSVYCLSADGKQLWSFKRNDAPMYSVCVIHKDGKPYVACGGFDKNLYYLSAEGKWLKTIPSISYSQEKPWQWSNLLSPKKKEHTANFIRPLKKKDGSETLILIGQIFQGGAGSIYQFEPLAETPFAIKKIKEKRPIGSFTTCDTDGDGNEELLLGANGSLNQAWFMKSDLSAQEPQVVKFTNMYRKIEGFGYRVVQPEIIKANDDFSYFVLYGSRIVLFKPDGRAQTAEVLKCRYAFNDMCKLPGKDVMVFASTQSGGSCIHILDLTQKDWKEVYANLQPTGKIQSILAGTANVRKQLASFEKPKYERAPLPVWFMSEGSQTRHSQKVVDEITANYPSPLFLGGSWHGKIENFDRSFMESERYRNRRDKRKKYTLTQQQALDDIIPDYEGFPGIAYWGGHGNDPNFYQVSTTKKVLDAAKGKKTVLIYPELEDHSEDFTWLMNYLLYPLAEHGKDRNGNLYIRCKHTFWNGPAYLHAWSRLVSGEFADVFVPAMEESHSKTMETSIASRMGLWAAGSVNGWGARCARDNASFDLSREHSHQMLPNHFLRHMIYNISCGAQYIDNFAVDQDYMSLLWELIAKGALYVPKREEIVSFNPVHLSMKEPDERFLEYSRNAHWTVFYDEQDEKENPMVFNRMNGSWKAAPVTEWDFGRYAAGITERRLNYMPSYPSGLVMITPPQKGVFADSDAPRGQLTDHLHPLYQTIMKEYITDGRNYYSANGKTTYAADEYYRKIEADITAGAKKLPLTVSGNKVAWVTAQTAPNHLRLTLVDGGYINPANRTASIQFHTVTPKKMTDLLSGESFDCADYSAIEIPIPCGQFRFIDIELAENLTN